MGAERLEGEARHSFQPVTPAMGEGGVWRSRGNCLVSMCGREIARYWKPNAESASRLQLWQWQVPGRGLKSAVFCARMLDRIERGGGEQSGRVEAKSLRSDGELPRESIDQPNADGVTMTKATGPHQVRTEKWIDCAPFERLLQMEIVEASNGQATLRMPFLIDFAQGSGLMHGGALVSLADTAVVVAIKSIVSPWTHFATVSLETKFLYPVKHGVVTAKATVTKQDEGLFRGWATVYNDVERPVLEFSSTFKIARDRTVRG
jgi:acyl-CoA thioesterase